MKKPQIILLLAFLWLSISVQAQETSVQPAIKKVTVFAQSAEIVHEANVSLVKGKNMLIFKGITELINAQSIRLNAKGVTIQSVTHQYTFLDSAQRSAAQEELMKRQIALTDKLGEARAKLADIVQERRILLANQSIGGQQGIKAEDLKTALDFFRARMQTLTQEEIAQNAKVKAIEEDLGKVASETNELNANKRVRRAMVQAVVLADQPSQTAFTLKYLVEGAGWFPTYDIRAKSVTDPLAITYKANVYQNTGIDWKGVKLSVASGNPAQNSTAPDLQPWRLDFASQYEYQTNYNDIYARQTAASVGGRVSGVVLDDSGEALPGVNIIVTGTSIGTVTDGNGSYSLMIPSNASTLSFSFVGYTQKTLPITAAQMNVGLQEDNVALQEVVVTGYGMEQKMKRPGSVTRSPLREEEDISYKKNRELKLVDYSQVEYQTGFVYEIALPYDIPTGGKPYSVSMKEYQADATYQYKAVPKKEEAVFLTAYLTDWGKYNFLAGEANLFFEENFVGKTLLSTQGAGDTLTLSLGKDESISIKRTKLDSFKEKRFIGGKAKESMGWEIAVRNAKAKNVSLLIEDQIPLSAQEGIKIEASNLGKALYNIETGKLVWNIDLKPEETQKITFSYSVEYPKGKTVILE